VRRHPSGASWSDFHVSGVARRSASPPHVHRRCSLSTPYRHQEDATLLVKLGCTPSSTEITSYVRNCGRLEVLVHESRLNCATERPMGDDSKGSEESGSQKCVYFGQVGWFHGVPRKGGRNRGRKV